MRDHDHTSLIQALRPGLPWAEIPSETDFIEAHRAEAETELRRALDSDSPSDETVERIRSAISAEQETACIRAVLLLAAGRVSRAGVLQLVDGMRQAVIDRCIDDYAYALGCDRLRADIDGLGDEERAA